MEFLLLEALFGLFSLVDAVDDESGLFIGAAKSFVGINVVTIILFAVVFVAYT